MGYPKVNAGLKLVGAVSNDELSVLSIFKRLRTRIVFAFVAITSWPDALLSRQNFVDRARPFSPIRRSMYYTTHSHLPA